MFERRLLVHSQVNQSSWLEDSCSVSMYYQQRRYAGNKTIGCDIRVSQLHKEHCSSKQPVGTDDHSHPDRGQGPELQAAAQLHPPQNLFAFHIMPF